MVILLYKTAIGTWLHAKTVKENHTKLLQYILMLSEKTEDTLFE
jgi:hypothetical protein